MNYLARTSLWSLLFILSVLSACTVQQQKNSGMLPPARGGKGEIVLVMDSAKWNGPLGDAMREVFQEALPALPQPEPIFSITSVTATEFKSILQQSRNIILVTTFDSNSPETLHLQRNFTSESKKMVMNGSDRFMFQKKDEFAAGQVLLHLFSEKEETLIQKVRENKKQLQDIFNSRETQAIKKKLLAQNLLSAPLMQSVEQNHHLQMKIPAGYRVAKDTADFMWLRFAEIKSDKNIIIAHKPYVSEDQFSDEAVIEWRNSLGKEHLYEDKEKNPEAYMITETKVKVIFEELELAGTYAKKAMGLWRIKEVFLGGGFRAYVFANAETGELFYVEGFLIAPGNKKREEMREIEIVLNTIQFADKKNQ